jgi:hypothetical protein
VVTGQVNEDKCSAHEAPDLSGIWMLEMSKSNLGSLKNNLLYDSLTLDISCHGAKLAIIRKQTKDKHERVQQLAYFIDGRGEKNPNFTGTGTIKSKTKWEGALLVSDGDMSTPTGGDTIVQTMAERWEISPDGKTLLQITSIGPFRSTFGKMDTISMFRGVEKIRRVFKKLE